MSWSTDFLGQPKAPETQDCDWCGDPAKVAFEIFKLRKKVGTAQYLYVCRKHEQIAKEASRAPRAAARAR